MIVSLIILKWVEGGQGNDIPPHCSYCLYPKSLHQSLMERPQEPSETSRKGRK